MDKLKGTLILSLVCIVCFFINPDPFSFNLERITSGEFYRILLSPFLHWNLNHLLLNLLGLLFFTGMAEVVYGTKKMLLYSAVFAFTVDLITSGMGSIVLPHALALKAFTESDCGISLVIHGCAGLNLKAMKYRNTATICLILFPLFLAIKDQSAAQFSHIVALGMGYLLSRKENN